MSVLSWPIEGSAFAVVDVETTGFQAGYDKIIEIAVAHADATSDPVLIVDTLVNPGRAVSGTEVHGITDEDVREAPAFSAVAPAVAAALGGRVLVIHNSVFDTRFLRAELDPELRAPMLCTMQTARLLGCRGSASLAALCEEMTIERSAEHCAAGDSLDTARLLQRLVARAREAGISTFGDLLMRGVRKGSKHSFLASLSHAALERAGAVHCPQCSRFRRMRPATVVERLRRYLHELMAAVADLYTDEQEVGNLAALRAELGLTDGEVRSVHGSMFAFALQRMVADGDVSDEECARLRALRVCLATAGWAPGD